MNKLWSGLAVFLFLNNVIAGSEEPVVSNNNSNSTANMTQKDLSVSLRSDDEKSDNEKNKDEMVERPIDSSDSEQEPISTSPDPDQADLYDDDETQQEEGDNYRPYGREVVQKPRAKVIRCSRRFTPGSCLEPMNSVWTYSYQEQNCTERLGCPPISFRTNCFKSFQRCTRVCMALSNIYTLVLDMEPRELRDKAAKDGTYRRRYTFEENKDAPTLPPLSESYSDNEGRPISHEYYDSLDKQHDNEIHPVPIDKDEFEVDPGELEDFYTNFNM